MTLDPIDGSSVASHMGHDPASNTLRVRFHSGREYEYSGVSPEDHQALKNAPSFGRHFGQFIRGKYPHREV